MTVATFSRKYRSWLTTTQANDADWRSSSNHSMAARSRWFVGSSNSRMSGCLYQCFSDREPLSPTAGERFCFNLKVFEPCSPERLSKAPLPLVRRNCEALKRGLDHCAYRLASRELRLLLHVAQTGTFA